MVQIVVTYQGDLHCLTEHGPSGAKLTTDAPKDNEGQGASFSPTDLVGTAMGTCMLTIMGIAARRHDWDLRNARVTVEKIMATAPARRIMRLEVVFEMPPGLDSSARKVLENAALTCPVHRSLHPDVEIPIEFRYPD
ncbi:MAG: OsmC family protein [Planctomycetota bacterium]